MKNCSVWNWDSLDYTHYVCPGKESVGGWGDVNPSTGPKPPPKDPIGKDIESLLPPLPAGCTPVGSSPQAKGQVVRAPRQPFRGFGATPPPEAGGFGRVVGVLAVGALVIVGVNLMLGPARR